MIQVAYRVAAVAVALLGLLSLQCSDPPNYQEIIYIDLGATFELAVQQTAIIKEADLSISMSTMLNDTRCSGEPGCIRSRLRRNPTLRQFRISGWCTSGLGQIRLVLD